MSTNRLPLASHALELRRGHPRLRVIAAILVFLLLVPLALSAIVAADVSSWSKKTDLGAYLKGRKAEDTLPGDAFANRDLNVLVIGSDHRDKTELDEKGRPITGMRSDTTLLVHISADRKRAEVMSIPRDLMVERPECTQADGSTVPASSGYVQFNSIFALLGKANDVAAATACTLKTIEEFTGIYIDEFAVMNFDGFQDMVKALGGVHMCIPEEINDPKSGLQLSAGCQVLNPQQALGFARARYTLGDGSDLSRIGRQQELLGAMFKDVKKRNLFTNMPALYAFLKAGMKSVTTSETFGSASNLGGLALSLSGLSPANIHFYMVPIADYKPDPARVALAYNAPEMFTALRTDTPVPSDFPYQDLDGNRVEGAPLSSTEPTTGPDSVGSFTENAPSSPTSNSSLDSSSSQNTYSSRLTENLGGIN